MIYFSCDECTNLLPCCPVRLICYQVTPCRLFLYDEELAAGVPAGKWDENIYDAGESLDTVRRGFSQGHEKLF